MAASMPGWRTYALCFLNARAFEDMNIAIHRQVFEFIYLFAGSGPMDFKLVNLHCPPQPQDQTRIVRRQVAATVVLEARAFAATGRPNDFAPAASLNR